MIIVDNIFQHLFVLSYTFLPGEIATFHQTVSKEASSVEVMATDGIPMYSLLNILKNMITHCIYEQIDDQ